MLAGLTSSLCERSCAALRWTRKEPRREGHAARPIGLPSRPARARGGRLCMCMGPGAEIWDMVLLSLLGRPTSWSKKRITPERVQRTH